MAEIQVEGTRAMSTIDPKDAHVLVIEDHPDNLFIIQMLLNQDVGVKFCDGRATGMNLFGFLAAHPTLRVDLILLDIQIPHEDGFEVLRQIRQRPLLQNTRVVAVTANVMLRDIEKARAAGFDGFIGKPISVRRFPEQIKRVLGGEMVWEPD